MTLIDCLSNFETEPHFNKVDLPLDLLEDLHVDLSGLKDRGHDYYNGYDYYNGNLVRILREWDVKLSPRLRKLTSTTNVKRLAAACSITIYRFDKLSLVESDQARPTRKGRTLQPGGRPPPSL